VNALERETRGTGNDDRTDGHSDVAIEMAMTRSGYHIVTPEMRVISVSCMSGGEGDEEEAGGGGDPSLPFTSSGGSEAQVEEVRRRG